ncbi:hypothetical protein DOS74_01595 [Staphylococcus felis]|uniref:DoxX family membrane protein n=1 Tax=Staphylococcus felis TaxID=46127 RepID=A0AAQ0HRC7_9STAP|nr:hypothetical protein [Staphylococcus felis]AVP35506.1 hypothetical protein C7J90_00355 [Staphylococcus felis]PNZ38162.1 hypothetical protein CD143_00915 [Staphylococcus felis]QQB02400.1 hypothetical protein I6H71_06295 [Staphylococcus felis]REH74676.1 hypothetical protein DOS57_11300 [Staphylococcus felis]REH76505.1 hypothetical protein DOS59_08515 [Staphylococcus felis]
MKLRLRRVLGIAFLMIGVLHFIKERQFRNIVPHYLPLRKTAVLVTGICEMVIGINLFIKRPSYQLKHWIIAFLWSVLPANIYMARKGLPLGDKQLSKPVLYARLPMQFVLMYVIRKL